MINMMIQPESYVANYVHVLQVCCAICLTFFVFFSVFVTTDGGSQVSNSVQKMLEVFSSNAASIVDRLFSRNVSMRTRTGCLNGMKIRRSTYPLTILGADDWLHSLTTSKPIQAEGSMCC